MNRRIPDADCTAYPWWVIVDPRQNFRVRDGHHEVASMVTGPWLSRAAAEEHLQARRYAYGEHAKVYCMSGHQSRDWRSLCNEAVPTDNPVTRAIRKVVPHFGRDDTDLLKAAIIYGSAHYTGKPRWDAVAELFGVGSTVAHHMCVFAGIDPDQVGEPDPAEVSS